MLSKINNQVLNHKGELVERTINLIIWKLINLLQENWGRDCFFRNTELCLPLKIKREGLDILKVNKIKILFWTSDLKIDDVYQPNLSSDWLKIKC